MLLTILPVGINVYTTRQTLVAVLIPALISLAG